MKLTEDTMPAFFKSTKEQFAKGLLERKTGAKKYK